MSEGTLSDWSKDAFGIRLDRLFTMSVAVRSDGNGMIAGPGTFLASEGDDEPLLLLLLALRSSGWSSVCCCGCWW